MEISVVSYEPKFKDDFKKLNVEWLEKYFEVEEHDLEQLEHPEEIIKQADKFILQCSMVKM